METSSFWSHYFWRITDLLMQNCKYGLSLKDLFILLSELRRLMDEVSKHWFKLTSK
jgi:hypothetical protein